MLRVARFAFDVDEGVFRGKGSEDALVIDLDDVDLMLLEQLHHREERAGPVLELDAQPRHPSRAGEIAQQDGGEEARVDIAASEDQADSAALEPDRKSTRLNSSH